MSDFENHIKLGHVCIRDINTSMWSRVSRHDHWKELRAWVQGTEMEEGWLHFSEGVPSFFLKRNGEKEYLKTFTPLVVGGYNMLTSRHDGNPDKLSMYESELSSSGKYRYWRNRVDNVAKAVSKADVLGACEITHHMMHDILERNPSMSASEIVLKPENNDGSVVFYNRARLDFQGQTSQILTHKRTQFALACLFRDLDTGARFWFVVLHLKSDGMGYNGSEEPLRVKQAMAAVKFINSLENLPCVIVGDLNSDQFLCDSWIASHTPHVKEVFRASGFESYIPMVTTYNHFERRCFDYILGRCVSHIQSNVPSVKSVCPNSTQGSDHLPVYSEVFVWS
jgi:endonuclease/exonuclease/phosphatase family metal-dependent hydrolase